jgi:phosphatidylserine/phosphatidylglycerophosphate/cardiolipin synthase-like enzyme
MAHLRRRPGVAGSRWPDRLERITGRATGTRPDYPRTVSTAFEGFASTRLGQFFGPAADEHPGLSGFSLLSHGREAFIVRLALADLAERSLDMQYYVWDGDTTGRIVVDHVMKAADRGVRVRSSSTILSIRPAIPSKLASMLTPMLRSVCSTRSLTGAGQFSTSFSISAGSIAACTTS